MSDIYVTNTLTNKKEEFVPGKEGQVSMYVCGMTVQDYPHLGHARAYITFDVIKRFLKHKGFQVKHVQNYTDIDDKIIAKAQTEGTSFDKVARKYTEAYQKDMKKLNIQPADEYPLATEHMPEIIEMIEMLINNGAAYQVDGDVYYSIRSKKDYGKLSGRSLDDLRAGERVEIDPRKKDPMDFALWKSSKPGEPAWDSPWGPGRPGWHIECSAMSLKHLEMGFDIHGGGQDLIFPHHENEIAQSESYALSEPFVRYWLHNGFVNLNAEKMSKSTGNFVYLHQLLERFDGQIIRLFVLSTFYRSPVDFTEEGLESTKSSLEGLMSAASDAYSQVSEGKPDHDHQIKHLLNNITENHQGFDRSMSDDFNTPAALSYVYALKDAINGFVKTIKGGAGEGDIDALNKARHTLVTLAAVMGLNIDSKSFLIPGDQTQEYNETEIGLKTGRLPEKVLDKDIEFPPTRSLAEELMKMRLFAKSQKNFADSDRIRDELTERGIFLEDTRLGTRYYAKPW